MPEEQVAKLAFFSPGHLTLGGHIIYYYLFDVLAVLLVLHC